MTVRGGWLGIGVLWLAGCPPEVACPVSASGATQAQVWFVDADGDGAGNPLLAEGSCDALVGHVTNADDCDDDDASIRPGAADDDCDGVDDDCDGQVDELGPKPWYYDGDGDGVGGERAVDACEPPSQFVAAADDCDDEDPERTPGATEACDGKDNDCNGTVDEQITATCYADHDNDGHGDPTDVLSVCGGSCPADRSVLADDCDDRDVLTWTGAGEQCDGKDNDCVSFTFPDQGADCGWTTPTQLAATGSVYVVLDASMSWDTAAETCDGLGYRLVWLDSEAEATFVRGLLDEPEEGAWTGLAWNACSSAGAFQRVDVHYAPARCAPLSAWETGELVGVNGEAAVLVPDGLIAAVKADSLYAVCELSP